MNAYDLTHLRDDALLQGLDSLAAQDRATTARLLAHIAEVDARRLYAPAGYSSMHAYCVGKLRLSEDGAFKRILVARAARRFPELYVALEGGRVHLSGLTMLAPHLTADNVDELLARSTHLRKAQIERLLVEAFPQPEPLRLDEGISALAPGQVDAGKIDPHPVPPNRAMTNSVPTRVAPVMARRFSVQVTIDEATHDLLRRAQALLGHAEPSGDLARVLHRALEEFVIRHEARKAGLTKAPRKPRPSERAESIPSHVRRVVWQRDEGRCTFIGDDGHRCESRKLIEYDHVFPLSRGGESTVENVRLLCGTHNQLEAERVLGREFMEARRSS